MLSTRSSTTWRTRSRTQSKRQPAKASRRPLKLRSASLPVLGDGALPWPVALASSAPGRPRRGQWWPPTGWLGLLEVAWRCLHASQEIVEGFLVEPAVEPEGLVQGPLGQEDGDAERGLGVPDDDTPGGLSV